MFLRIDKVSGSNNALPTPSNDCLHACLATATANVADPIADGGGGQQNGGLTAISGDRADATGELFIVGRKNAAVTIDDKCVSRKHASIHLLSKTPLLNQQQQQSLEEAPLPLPDILQGRIIMEYGTPSTPEEIAACESSPNGVICVLKDLGSKFGTFVQVDEGLLDATTPRTSHSSMSAAAAAAAANEGGDETADEETDDEGFTDGKTINYHKLTDKQEQAVHHLLEIRKHSSFTIPKFVKMEANKSVPLLSLSHSKSSSVIILFGGIGSAIRLSLLPLQFTFSSITPKTLLQSYISSLHYIGASHNQWDVNQSTHLVALEKKANAKAIAAWASGRPVVTLDYIDALLARKELSDALPKEEDYPPKGSSQLDLLSYSGECSTALKGYCIAVLMEDDNGPLAQSAGAKILKLYENAPYSSQTEFDAWWTSQQQNATNAKMVLVVADSKSSKCKPFNTWLHKRNDVKFTSAKHIAQAITGNNGEGALLLDTKKDTIEKIEGWDAAKEEESAAKGMAKSDEEMKTSENVFDAKGAGEEQPKQKEAMHAGEKRSKEKVVIKEAADKDNLEDRPPEKKRRHGEEQKESTKEKEHEIVTEPAEQSRDHSFDANMDTHSDDEPGLPDERIPLPTTTDGWLVAAPKSRKAYRKVIDGTETDNPMVAAETQKVSGLIVRKPAADSHPNGRSARKQKDFKRFRKNHVIRGFSTSKPNYADYHHSNGYNTSLPKIRLVSVLPKESERQRQLEMQQQELEREQEIADSLFNDTGGGGGGNRGRKSGNNSMYQYLSQKTTNKKGRGRR